MVFPVPSDKCSLKYFITAFCHIFPLSLNTNKFPPAWCHTMYVVISKSSRNILIKTITSYLDLILHHHLQSSPLGSAHMKSSPLQLGFHLVEEKEVTRSWVWWVRWVGNNCHLVFSQKFLNNVSSMQSCVVMPEYPFVHAPLLWMFSPHIPPSITLEHCDRTLY
jgi:hypothetical protein